LLYVDVNVKNDVVPRPQPGSGARRAKERRCTS
jgi:hypothetical protein